MRHMLLARYLKALPSWSRYLHASTGLAQSRAAIRTRSTKSYDGNKAGRLFEHHQQPIPPSLKPEELDIFRLLADLRSPWNWYPLARRLSRRIICHVGPTNSGKTYAAIRQLKQARTGVYCAPLRLLAQEMYERLNAEGLSCALRTGELTKGPVGREDEPWSSAPLVACTIEMLDFEHKYEVAVIDEIQMMSDLQRGWAFTQAFLGVCASKVYLCGEEAALPLIKLMCEKTEEQLTVETFNRLAPLELGQLSLGADYSQIQRGDCIVTFSRRAIFDLKQEIERKTGRKCAVVYGNLPAESRTYQAQVFNDPESEYEVMIASDAIGMGLNLNIRRIVFHTMQKYNGSHVQLVSPQQVKQIAGRAGRFNTQFPSGFVTTFMQSDMEYLRTCMSKSNSHYESAGLFPPASHVEAIIRALPLLSLPQIMDAYETHGKVDPGFFMCDGTDFKETARLVARLRLPPKEMYTIACAPVKTRDMDAVDSFKWFIQQMAASKPCPVRIVLPKRVPEPGKALLLCESINHTLELYLWLATRFPRIFTESNAAVDRKLECEDIIARSLDLISMSNIRQSRKTSSPPLPSFNSPTKGKDGSGGIIEKTRPLKAQEIISASTAMRINRTIGLEEVDMLLKNLFPEHANTDIDSANKD